MDSKEYFKEFIPTSLFFILILTILVNVLNPIHALVGVLSVCFADSLTFQNLSRKKRNDE